MGVSTALLALSLSLRYCRHDWLCFYTGWIHYSKTPLGAQALTVCYVKGQYVICNNAHVYYFWLLHVSASTETHPIATCTVALAIPTLFEVHWLVDVSILW